jgi:hypothetical protein
LRRSDRPTCGFSSSRPAKRDRSVVPPEGFAQRRIPHYRLILYRRWYRSYRGGVEVSHNK